MKSKLKKGSSSGDHSSEIGMVVWFRFSVGSSLFLKSKSPETIKLSDTVIY